MFYCPAGEAILFCILPCSIALDNALLGLKMALELNIWHQPALISLDILVLVDTKWFSHGAEAKKRLTGSVVKRSVTERTGSRFSLMLMAKPINQISNNIKIYYYAYWSIYTAYSCRC